MKLIYLHGPPASGKYTIAKELKARIGCAIFHNHLTIDVARAFYEFDTGQFWPLVDLLRKTVVQFAAENSVPCVVCTGCYNHPGDLEGVKERQATVRENGGEFLPVFLECGQPELESRLGADHRKEMRKLTSVEIFRESMEQYNYCAMPLDNCITVVTEGRTPQECAEEIVSVLAL